MKYNTHNSTASSSSSAAAASSTRKTITKLNRTWLLNNVNPDPDVIKILVDTLKSTKSDVELQNELFDMIGFDRFELLQQILENRKIIIQNVDTEDKKIMLLEKTLLGRGGGGGGGGGGGEQRPLISRQVVIQSEQEKQLMKRVRKDEKKLKTLLNDENNEYNNYDGMSDGNCDINGNGTDLDNNIAILMKLKQAQQRQLLQNSSQRPSMFDDNYSIQLPSNSTSSSSAAPLNIFTQSSVKYPFVFVAQLEAKSHIGFIAGSKIMLPDNVERVDSKTFEEVKIPANEETMKTLTVGNARIQINSLDEIGQVAFKGTKELNRIQSIVYPIAYHTNDNLLVCAPTGAGKTNVAMLAIVRTLRSFADQGVIHREQFKIVYVAPMKALAAEMVTNFGRRLAPLGILVRELTGDMQLTKTEMQETQMLVTTPEKWDVVTRKGAGDVALITLVKLLIIDEVHLLHGERGPVVEALVARTLRLVESSQSMIRIVGLSATLPNYIDVARFLRVNPMVGLFFFDARFRPVPLAQNFIGVKSIKTLQQLNDMDQICYDKCVEMLRQGHQIMVFVHARNATVRTGNVLREMAQQKGQLPLFMPEDTTDYGLAQRAMSKSSNKQLVELFHCGKC